VKDGIGYWTSYPKGEVGKPSIPETKIIVPLNWFFQRRTSDALPISSMIYTRLSIKLDLRPLRELYRLYDKTKNEYVSPNEYDTRGFGYWPITKFINQPGGEDFADTTPINIEGYLEAQYALLTRSEGLLIANNPNLEYLVDSPQVLTADAKTVNNFVLNLYGPCKEMIWFFRRSDVERYNTWNDFTADEDHILKDAQILFDDVPRTDVKPNEFWSTLQPYMHHGRVPRKGLYLYSFSIDPAGPPSGSANLSEISSVKMRMNLNPTAIPGTDVNSDGTPISYYQLTFINLHWNIFTITSGLGRLKYARI